MSTTLKSPASNRSFDRRRSTREPLVVESWICNPASMDVDQDRIEVTSINLSRHGVAFELPRAITEGSYFTMEIGIGEQRLLSEIKVVSIRRIEKGHFAVGAEFC